jgi:hypothetical protein
MPAIPVQSDYTSYKGSAGVFACVSTSCLMYLPRAISSSRNIN